MQLITKSQPIIVVDHAATGAAARSEREATGMTSRQAALALGISKTYLCHLEVGKRHWRQELVDKFNELFGK